MLKTLSLFRKNADENLVQLFFQTWWISFHSRSVSRRFSLDLVVVAVVVVIVFNTTKNTNYNSLLF